MDLVGVSGLDRGRDRHVQGQLTLGDHVDWMVLSGLRERTSSDMRPVPSVRSTPRGKRVVPVASTLVWLSINGPTEPGDQVLATSGTSVVRTRTASAPHIWHREEGPVSGVP